MTRQLLLALVLLLSPKAAGATDLITLPEPSIWLAPPSPAGSSQGQLAAQMGDTSVVNPSWIIMQTNYPQSQGTGANYTADPGASWSANIPGGRVQFYATYNSQQNTQPSTYELAQAGAFFPCGPEYDLFAASAPSQGYTDPSGNPIASRFSSSAPINQLSTVSLVGGLNIVYESINSGCDVNAAAYFFGVTLQSTSGYSLSYRILLRETQGGAEYNMQCPGYPQNSSYCFSTGVTQLSQGLRNQAADGNRVVYNFGILQVPDERHLANSGHKCCRLANPGRIFWGVRHRPSHADISLG